MAARDLRSVAACLMAGLFGIDASAEVAPPELTPAGKAVLQNRVEHVERTGQAATVKFPMPICMFPGGLCGAVHRDGRVAIPPNYDWVGRFEDGRAAVRVNGLYGFVDEDGREIVTPQYRIVDDYKFGFAQVDVDGKSGLIDREGKMAFEPKYGFIEAVAADRFRISKERKRGGSLGAEDFSGSTVSPTPNGGIIIIGRRFWSNSIDEINRSGQLIKSGSFREFDATDPALRWAERDGLWGLARADGSWLVEPHFEQIDQLRNGLARVTLRGKMGFIDRSGRFAIEPVFENAGLFKEGYDRTSAQRDGISGVIDKTGRWVFQTRYQKIGVAVLLTGFLHDIPTVYGWHFNMGGKWGLLDPEGRLVLDATFDQSMQKCQDGRLAGRRNKQWLYFKPDGTPLQPSDGVIVDGTCQNGPPYILNIGDKFELIDAEARRMTPERFEAAYIAGPNVRNVKLDGKWGRIGPAGQWLLAPRFDYFSYGTGLFVAGVDGKRGFMREDGTWIIEPKFDAANTGGFVTIGNATGLIRLTDQAWIIPPRPGVMCSIANAVMHQSEGKRAILSQSGDVWIDIGAERIGIDLDAGLLTFLKAGKWGLVDTAGTVIAEPRFEEPVFFSPGRRGIAWVKNGERWCAIDRRLQPVSSIQCEKDLPLGATDRFFACQVE